ncbi:MAG TPA: hypothetical protein VFG72_12295 [Marmoricola sp.]|nr:hypothetical protein [Marmoricola sp.]
MDGLDSATWQALGLVLTVAGLGFSALLWSRRGPASGVRGAAWSLLPLAAGLTGVLELGWEITDSVVSWAARLAFSPVVWLGLVVAAVSMVLFVVSGWMRRRGAGRSGKGAVAAGRGEPAAGQLPRRRSTPAATAGTAGGPSKAGSKTGSEAGAGDGMDEIEEILRRHGIQ